MRVVLSAVARYVARMLPKRIARVQVPPIKTQGIKTKLVPFIAANIRWDGTGRWIEPSMGSGVVLFTTGAARALAADSNTHLVRFYRAVQEGLVNPTSARLHLESEGAILRSDSEHFYRVRERFNAVGDP